MMTYLYTHKIHCGVTSTYWYTSTLVPLSTHSNYKWSWCHIYSIVNNDIQMRCCNIFLKHGDNAYFTLIDVGLFIPTYDIYLYMNISIKYYYHNLIIVINNKWNDTYFMPTMSLVNLDVKETYL